MATIFLILLVITIAVAVIMYNVAPEGMFGAMCIPGIPALIFMAIMFGISNKMKKYCSSCHNLLSGCAYEWTVIGQTYNKNADEFRVTYNVIHTCPHCGKTDSDKITMNSKNGYGDCEVKMNNYCVKRFGH